MSEHSKATQQLLDMLHGEVAKALLEKIKNGEAVAADLNAAVRFLSDNGVKNIPTAKDVTEELRKSVPFQFPSDPEPEAHHFREND
jgi:hypothetical protein